MNLDYLNKKTKIVCTIGPASNTEEMIMKLIDAGMDIARLNFSHSTYDQHEKVYNMLRKCEQRSGRPIGILADLQGPKIRTGKMKDGPFDVAIGDKIYINTIPGFLGTKEEISTIYTHFLDDIDVNHKVLIDDGKIMLNVISKTKEKALLEVLVPGTIKDSKGINLPGSPVSAPALTEKDKEDLKFSIDLGVDYIALSFVRKASDLQEARDLMKEKFNGLIAKIERPEALKNIDEIIAISDAIMIARGDLGVEMETEQVPTIQKELIYKANLAGKPVITATQMLESMIDNPRPTRAEASDVANAVLDGTDAVMLSAESASGHYPIESVAIMNKIIREAERFGIHSDDIINDLKKANPTEAIALGIAAEQVAHSINAKAIINFTRSGFSARIASQFRPDAPIFSFTPFLLTARKMNLHRGVYPMIFPVMDKFNDMINYVNEKVKELKILKVGDNVIILSGAPGGEANKVKLLQIFTIEE